MGNKTFGKGLVQSVLDLPSGSGLTLTSARYLTPTGRSIQRDYSRIGLYDYFRHTTPAADISKPYFEARTPTDRKVLGGDGIMPDELIEQPELSLDQIALLDPIFFFIRDMANGRVNIASAENLNASEAGNLTVQNNAGLVAAFAGFLKLHPEFKITKTALAAEKDFIDLRLRHDLSMATNGSNAATHTLLEDDLQAAKAVELLPQAAQLAQLAAKTRKQ